MTQLGTLITNAPDVTKAIHDILNERSEELGLAHVYYGAQELIPEFPAIMVESGPKRRRQSGTHRFEVDLAVTIMIIHGKLQSSTVTKEETERFAESIENVLHEDHYLGGRVLFGFVSGIQPGTTRITEVMYRATRVTWEALSKEGFN